ncbi:hypothetical protein HDV04_003798 [Boothiomyces sp. JEL0838]|nr:hypothetical protein HDV04_003798 [Boothiomyces sp. JEL0838]
MTVEDERTFLENLHLSRLIKENHGECLIECCFFKSEIKDIYNPTNLLAVIGGKQANIYDNEHCGTHLDIMSQFNCDQNLTCCCWIKVEYDIWLAVGDINGSIHILSVAESEELSTFTGHSGPIYDIISREKTIITCSDEGIFIWDLKGAIKHSIPCDASRIAIDQLGSWLVAGNMSGSLYKIDLNDHSIQFVGGNVLTKSVDGKIVYWNLETESIIHTFNTGDRNKCRLDVSAQLQYFCVGTETGLVNIYSLLDGSLVSEISHKRSSKSIKCTGFSRNCNNLVFVGEDALVWRFDYKPPVEALKEAENIDVDPIVQ